MSEPTGPQIAKAAAALMNAPEDLERFRWVDFGPGRQGPHSHLAFPTDSRGGRPIVYLRRKVEVDGQWYRIGWNSYRRVAGYSKSNPDPKTGIYQIEWWEQGQRRARSLKHRDWDRARKQCDEFAASYVTAESQQEESPESEPLTLGRLFDIYRCEVTPTKGERTQEHDRAAAKIFLDLFGGDRDPKTLSTREWDRFIRERSAGRIGGRGERVGSRTVERDLRWLLAVLNWASSYREETGELLLEQNPLRGSKPPMEKNPVRVVLSDDEYRLMLEVSADVDWRFKTALVLAHETGHRIGGVRTLLWSDVDLERALSAGELNMRRTATSTRRP